MNAEQNSPPPGTTSTTITTTYTREWVGLTDEEIDNINYTSAYMLAREVEALLRKKNT